MTKIEAYPWAMPKPPKIPAQQTFRFSIGGGADF